MIAAIQEVTYVAELPAHAVQDEGPCSYVVENAQAVDDGECSVQSLIFYLTPVSSRTR